MKSYNHLMEQFLAPDNYLFAVHNATRHKGGKKRKYRKARYYRDNAEALMPEMLDYAAHFHSETHTPKLIYDGIRRKQRTITVPTMKEQIVHHMVVNVLKPIFMKSMYEHSYGSVPGRGAHSAKKQIEKWIRHGGKNCKYCLKMDVRKYFDSIPRDRLKAKLAELIHDKDFLHILYEIVDVDGGDSGIPIGFYTSQWFTNWYLTELDHYIKEELRAIYYVRYMDDMVIFGGNKRELHRMRKQIESYLNENLGLEMKENWQVFRFDFTKKNGQTIGRDLDFMGFRFYRNRTVLRRSVMLKATRKAKRVVRKDRKTIYDCRQMLAYLGWLSVTDTYGMYRKRIKPYVSFRALRRRESTYQKSENRRMSELCGTNLKTAA